MRKLGKMKFDALVDAVSAADRRRFITLLGGTAVWPLAAGRAAIGNACGRVRT
jgi:hypothetical protein